VKKLFPICSPTGHRMSPLSRKTSLNGARSRAGFSMIEIITAVFVLAILMLILARLIAGGTDAMTQGRASMNANSSARAVLGFMERQLSALVVDDRLELEYNSPSSFCFWSLDHEVRPGEGPSTSASDHFTAVQNQRYHLDLSGSGPLGTLSRKQRCNAGGNQLLETTTSFAVIFYQANGIQLPAGTHNTMPAYADIHLTMLSDEDATQALIIPSGAAQNEFLTNKQRGYFSRVYFQNYNGYTSGYEN